MPETISPDERAASSPDPKRPLLIDGVAIALMAVALLSLLALHLLLALIAGLSAFALHRALEAGLTRRMSGSAASKVAMLLVLALLVVVVGFTFDRLTGLSTSASPESLTALLQLMADSLDRLRTAFPPWMADHIPSSAESLRQMASHWLRENAAEVQRFGHHTLRGIVYVLAGIVIGLLASYAGRKEPAGRAAFMQSWRERLSQLEHAFADIIAAQLRIAAMNAVLTAIYLLAVVPLLGYHLPFTATLIVVTFVAGLIPVVGNLMSNTAIVLTSLVVSPWLAVLSLAFLVGIHKLEYFLNAHIVGSRIRVPTYELLAVMLVLEATFGLAGVVAAPIYYAWFTRELRLHDAI
jgi:predicted PurR-regulated permease PerM